MRIGCETYQIESRQFPRRLVPRFILSILAMAHLQKGRWRHVEPHLAASLWSGPYMKKLRASILREVGCTSVAQLCMLEVANAHQLFRLQIMKHHSTHQLTSLFQDEVVRPIFIRKGSYLSRDEVHLLLNLSAAMMLHAKSTSRHPGERKILYYSPGLLIITHNIQELQASATAQQQSNNLPVSSATLCLFVYSLKLSVTSRTTFAAIQALIRASYEDQVAIFALNYSIYPTSTHLLLILR